MAHTTAKQPVIKELGNGLIIRRATADDAEALACFQADQHSESPPEPDPYIKAMMLDLMSGSHPTFQPADFLIVEDTVTGQIASSMALISQEWSYGGVQFKVGQPELVGTHPDYRRRGLVREQFNVIHEWSRERGELVQAIMGIPWYYRQFGYELALPLHGGRVGYRVSVPPLKPGATEPYNLRPATEADIPFMIEMDRQAAARTLVSAVRDEAMWRYELGGRRGESLMAVEMLIIGKPTGEAIGMLVHRPRLWSAAVAATFYEVRPGVPWTAVTPAVIRYMEATGKAYAERDKQEWQAYIFRLGADHPAYHAARDRLPKTLAEYAWYMRVPDLPAFIRHVAPALERRIEGSIMEGYTGEVQLNFYRTGLLLGFEEGKLVKSLEWRAESTNDGNAGFPDLTFLQLLFGFRSLSDLEYSFPDCTARDDTTRALLDALFPKQPSVVWAIG